MIGECVCMCACVHVLNLGMYEFRMVDHHLFHGDTYLCMRNEYMYSTSVLCLTNLQYWSVPVRTFLSFATVVIFLKILLQQADLDKPFTGGLGSYKLYVLVASHVSSHLHLSYRFGWYRLVSFHFMRLSYTTMLIPYTIQPNNK